jgi:hypothetical protein
MSFVSWPRWLPLALVAAMGIPLALGCSSSSSPAAVTDASSPESSVATNNDAGASPGADSGHAGDSGAPSAAEAGPDCGPPGSAASFMPATYLPAVGNQGVCTAADVANFVNVCILGTTEAPCNSWSEANVASDAGAGTPCGNCILPVENNGPIWSDPLGYIWPNTAACIQLSDPTTGPACAAAFNNIAGCVDTACDPICSMDSEYCGGVACSSCSMDLETTTCTKYQTAFEQSCMSVSALDTCQSANTQAVAFANIITMICGGSPVDGGAEQ